MICKHCERELPLEMFYENRHAKSGRFRICTDCWGCVFNCSRRNGYDGLRFRLHTYIENVNPPRTLAESFLDGERRREDLRRRGRERSRVDGLMPLPK